MSALLHPDAVIVDSADGQRKLPLDALRGVAIALVIVHHVWWRFPLIQDGALARFVAGIGWAGVDLFFGISGYLIATILLKARARGAVRSFFVKRFFRIVPIYIVALVAFVVVSVLTGNDRDVLGRIWINVLLLTAWAIPFVGEEGVPYTISWSVSVEEFAYILFGAIAATSTRLLKQSLGWIVCAALLLRLVSIVAFSFEPITLYYFAPGRIDAIAMGGVFAALSPAMRDRLAVSPWMPWGAWIALVAACAYARRESPLVATVGYTLIAFASAWVVLCVVNAKGSSHWWITRWLAALGLVSYFVYLFHGFVIGALSLAFPSGAASVIGIWGLSLVVILVTYLAARISWRYLEYPLILKGRRLADGFDRSIG